MATAGADLTTGGVGTDLIVHTIQPTTATIGPTGVCITGLGITGPSTVAPIGGLLTTGPSITAGLTGGPLTTTGPSIAAHIGGEALSAAGG